MSSDGWKFKDRKSMVISLCVIAVLVLCMYGFWRNQQTHMVSSLEQKVSLKESQLLELFDKRFSLLSELAEKTRDEELSVSVRSYQQDPSLLSDAYNKSDKRLLSLQRELAKSGKLDAMQGLFTELTRVEDQIVPLYQEYQLALASYHGKVRRGAKSFPQWDIAQSLGSRP